MVFSDIGNREDATTKKKKKVKKVEKATQTEARNWPWYLLLLLPFLFLSKGREAKVGTSTHDVGVWDLDAGACGVRGDGVIRCAPPVSPALLLGDPPTIVHKSPQRELLEWAHATSWCPCDE